MAVMERDDTAPAGEDDWQAVVPDLGARMGRYELRSVLGAGGMGVVFEAIDPELDRAVAVKVLLSRAGGLDSAGAARLRREGVTMARLTHPNVIRVYDVGVAMGHVFVAMELVRGCTLADWVARSRRSPEEIIAAYVQAGRGLAAAHDAGLVHRDFKPQNVLVGDDGRVLVTDFGLAREVGAEETIEPGTTLRSPAGSVTRTGEVLGTPGYMAPEQALGGVIDARADQFSFCVALWRALGGSAPRELATATGTASPWLSRFDETSGASVPARIRGALLRGLELAPKRRFASMHELLARLEPPRPRPRAWPWALAAAGILAAGGMGTWAVVARSGVSPAAADPCAAQADRFGAIWSDGARGEVRAAFAATGLSYADTSFREVARQLDARALAWEAARRDSCEDTRIRREQSDAMMDLRATCLERRLADVEAFIAELRTADAAAVGGAAAAALTIGDVTACGDAAALARRAPLPADPRARETIAQIELQVSAVRASTAAARLQAAASLAEIAVARARATGYAPLIADALVAAGEAQMVLEHAEPARALYEEAALMAEAGGDDLLRFDCEAALVRVYGYQLERDPEATQHAERAEALLKRLGPDPRRSALLARNRANVDWWAGRYETGWRRAQEAVELFERIDPTGADMAKTLHLRAILENEMRDDAACVATEARALAIAEAALGADHQVVAAILQTSAGSLGKLERYQEARDQLRRALRICEATFGAESMRAGAVLLDLATIDLHEEKFEDAVTVLRRSLAISEKVSGPEHSRTALANERLGSALSRAGHHAEGERALRRAIEIHRKRLGPDSPATAASIKVLGKHFARIGRHAEARDAFAEAARALDASQGPGSNVSIQTWLLLGDEELALGNRAAAVAAYQRALAAIDADDEAYRKQVQAKLDAIAPGR